MPSAMVLCRLLWSYAVCYGLMPSAMVLCRLLWSYAVCYGLMPSAMVLCRLLWSYAVCYGLVPYFKQQLHGQVHTLDSFAILFDERQMDIHIRFFHNTCNAVHTRYLTSVFLGHVTTANMADAFLDVCRGVNLNRMLQLSMDGPNVNW